MALIRTRAIGCPHEPSRHLLIFLGAVRGHPPIAQRADIRPSMGDSCAEKQHDRHDAADNDHEEEPRHENLSAGIPPVQPVRSRVEALAGR
jgi:hypothetical protein